MPRLRPEQPGALALVAGFGRSASVGCALIGQVFPDNGSVMLDAVVPTSIGSTIPVFVIGVPIAVHFATLGARARSRLPFCWRAPRRSAERAPRPQTHSGSSRYGALVTAAPETNPMIMTTMTASPTGSETSRKATAASPPDQTRSGDDGNGQSCPKAPRRRRWSLTSMKAPKRRSPCADNCEEYEPPNQLCMRCSIPQDRVQQPAIRKVRQNGHGRMG